MRGNRRRSSLIVVSNREPYTIKRDGRLEKTVGGLVSALDPVMCSARGVWIASTRARRGIKVEVPPEAPSYTMRLVPISTKDFEDYYDGYSNSFLWPLCHITLDRVYLRDSYWDSYRKVNQLFAEAVVEEADGRKTLVWLQDYHLALCAGYIKKKNPSLKLSLFWHIPWPPYDVFRACPHRKEILRGLLANDLLGFQIEAFTRNFLRCVELELKDEATIEGDVVYTERGRTRVRAFPISIDYGWFEEAALSRKAERFLRRFKKERNLQGRLMGLSVDRLDYTKGIIRGLSALELFFDKYPEFKRRFSFVQIAVPTRVSDTYLDYMETVRRKVYSINSRFATGDWRPIEYIEKKFTHEELAGLYRGADLLMISSVYDGMNLVAKEYIASQIDMGGVVLVSLFAGVSEDVPGVITVNPYATENYADTIKMALEMSDRERQRLMKRARSHVRKNDIYRWVDGILREIRRTK
ncbi:MAG TPA: trehalose-6-phosphate synthase [Deltaproteobacteria bacterium]|nr:trehalose-6-phosphate synthase [Deltaproteobacteria bacterium]